MGLYKGDEGNIEFHDKEYYKDKEEALNNRGKYDRVFYDSNRKMFVFAKAERCG